MKSFIPALLLLAFAYQGQADDSGITCDAFGPQVPMIDYQRAFINFFNMHKGDLYVDPYTTPWRYPVPPLILGGDYHDTTTEISESGSCALITAQYVGKNNKASASTYNSVYIALFNYLNACYDGTTGRTTAAGSTFVDANGDIRLDITVNDPDVCAG